MSQRLSSTRKHPITGEEIAPLWFDQNGIAFYLPMGAAPDGDDDGNDGQDGGDGGDGDSGNDGSEGQDGSGDGSDDKKVTPEALASLEARMKAADKRAAAAEARAKELEDKDKDEATKTAERAAALESENKTLKETVNNLTLKNAFLASNDIAWHDSEVALSNADLSEVMQEDGTVDRKALKKALEDLSKAKPFLVKSEDGDSQKDKDSAGPSGGNVGTGKKKDKQVASDAALRKKYPALYN